ncbi:tetratricopeptide repeat protein [Lentzea sp.]|uniref:tetratricopeptide repeat protein n=1 Tax=Lentzea sp. TaxID=56099 RepID=UPI002ED66533
MANPAYFPPPHSARIGMSDVDQLEAQTRSLRSVDYRHGGGACRDAVVVRIYWAQQLLAAEASDVVRSRLLSAVADLHNLAGWTSFDSGQVGAAYHHFDRALDFARHDEDLTTNIVYRRGRVHLHHGAPGDALAYFQRGAFAPLASSIMFVNEAWAYARQGRSDEAVRALGRAKDSFAAADLAHAPDWARFHDETDLVAMTGIVHAELGDTRAAIPALRSAIESFGPAMARSSTFCLIALATCHFLDGDADEGTAVGTRAMNAAEELRSERVWDRMRPLVQAAASHGVSLP